VAEKKSLQAKWHSSNAIEKHRHHVQYNVVNSRIAARSKMSPMITCCRQPYNFLLPCWAGGVIPPWVARERTYKHRHSYRTWNSEKICTANHVNWSIKKKHGSLHTADKRTIANTTQPQSTVNFIDVQHCNVHNSIRVTADDNYCNSCDLSNFYFIRAAEINHYLIVKKLLFLSIKIWDFFNSVKWLTIKSL